MHTPLQWSALNLVVLAAAVGCSAGNSSEQTSSMATEAITGAQSLNLSAARVHRAPGADECIDARRHLRDCDPRENTEPGDRRYPNCPNRGTGGASATGGASPTGGTSPGGATAAALANDCAAICNIASGSQGLQCPTNAQPTVNSPLDTPACIQSCTGYADPAFGSSADLIALYDSMMACVAQKLTSLAEYQCAPIGAAGGSLNLWSPVAGTACESQLCAWTCSDATFVNSSVYARCGC